MSIISASNAHVVPKNTKKVQPPKTPGDAYAFSKDITALILLWETR